MAETCDVTFSNLVVHGRFWGITKSTPISSAVQVQCSSDSIDIFACRLKSTYWRWAVAADSPGEPERRHIGFLKRFPDSRFKILRSVLDSVDYFKTNTMQCPRAFRESLELSWGKTRRDFTDTRALIEVWWRVLNFSNYYNLTILQDGDPVRDKNYILALLAMRPEAVLYRGRAHLSDLTIMAWGLSASSRLWAWPSCSWW